MTIASRLSRVETMRAWRQISHSDIPHIRQELAKGLYNVYTGILETHQTTPEILEDAIHSPHRILSRLPQRYPSPKDITILNQPTPPPGLQLTAALWRQPSTRLPSRLCLTRGLTLPTLRRSQVLTNIRMLMVIVILNFKNLERTQGSFWSSFLEKYVPYTFFVCPTISTCIYHHHHRASYFTHGSDLSTMLIFIFQVLRSLESWTSLSGHLSTIRLTPQFGKKVMLSSVPRISGIFIMMSKNIDGSWTIGSPWINLEMNCHIHVPWIVDFP